MTVRAAAAAAVPAAEEGVAALFSNPADVWSKVRRPLECERGWGEVIWGCYLALNL
jgi:hypothetical protein